MFLGTHAPRLDDKGRLFLPAKWRAEFAAGVVVTKGQERCLVLYPTAEFERATAAIAAAPATNKTVRDFARQLFGSASDETPDGQGRITVPGPLRTYAGLTKECVVIGYATRAELWDAATWAAYSAETEPAFVDQSTEIVPGVM